MFRTALPGRVSGALSGLAAADYVTGTKVNTTRWSIYNGTGSQGLGLRRPSHVTVFIHFGSSQHDVIHSASGTQWHKILMEWTPSAMRIHRDGTLIRTITDASRTPDARHHVAMQLEAVKNSMSSTARMYVEYIRIFRRV
jgi:hypothetical protein